MKTSAKAVKPSKRSAQTGAERQRRHRQRQKLHALEVRNETYTTLQTICMRKRWTIKRGVAEAVTLLQEQLAVETRAAQSVEMHRRALEEQRKIDQAYPRTPAKPRTSRQLPVPEAVEGQGSLL